MKVLIGPLPFLADLREARLKPLRMNKSGETGKTLASLFRLFTKMDPGMAKRLSE